MRILFFIICFICSVSAQDLKPILQRYKVPALAIAKLVEGKIHQSVIGVRSFNHEVLVGKSDQWHFGSIGKSMTATLVAVLVEKGILEWDRVVTDYLPNYKIHSDFQQTTLRKLLAHRSGMVEDMNHYNNGKLLKLYLDESIDPIRKRKLMSKMILQQKATHSEEDWIYSNLNFVTAAVIMNEVTGKTWEQLIEAFLFRPLSLKSCGFGAAGKDGKDVPTQPWGHMVYKGETYPIPPWDKYADNFPVLAPSGSVHCSLTDWMKYAQVHLDGFNRKDTKVLRAEGFKPLHSDYKKQSYTSGAWMISEKNKKITLGHNGSNVRNFALLILDPKESSAYSAVSNIGSEEGLKAIQAGMRLMRAPDVCMRNGFCLIGKETSSK